MTLNEFQQVQRYKTRVVCMKKDKNMPGGWNIPMDSMVGKPYIVEAIAGEHVHLRYDDSHTFAYHFKYIELYDNNKVYISITWKGKKFKCANKIHTGQLSELCLVEDYSVLTNNIKLVDSNYIESTSNLFDTIQQKCPRIIGVLLSNGYIKRV